TTIKALPASAEAPGPVIGISSFRPTETPGKQPPASVAEKPAETPAPVLEKPTEPPAPVPEEPTEPPAPVPEEPTEPPSTGSSELKTAEWSEPAREDSPRSPEKDPSEEHNEAASVQSAVSIMMVPADTEKGQPPGPVIEIIPVSCDT